MFPFEVPARWLFLENDPPFCCFRSAAFAIPGRVCLRTHSHRRHEHPSVAPWSMPSRGIAFLEPHLNPNRTLVSTKTFRTTPQRAIPTIGIQCLKQCGWLGRTQTFLPKARTMQRKKGLQLTAQNRFSKINKLPGIPVRKSVRRCSVKKVPSAIRRHCQQAGPSGTPPQPAPGS